jgi:hypothetical protein
VPYSAQLLPAHDCARRADRLHAAAAEQQRDIGNA